MPLQVIGRGGVGGAVGQADLAAVQGVVVAAVLELLFDLAADEEVVIGGER